MASECLGFYYSAPSFQFSHFLPQRSHSSLPPIPLFLILLPSSYPFLECRRRGAAGRLRRCLGSGGATTPGAALGPGGCHPRGRPGLSRAPARTPQSPKSHWEVWAGEARNGGGSRGRFAVVTEAQADGDEKSGAGLPFMERSSGSPSGSGGARFQIGRCPGLAKIASSDPRRALPGASGGRGLGGRPELFGPAEVRNRELSGAGRFSASGDLPQLH